MARITVSELRKMLDTGKAPLIFDLRSSEAVKEEPLLIQGAVHLSVEEIESRLSEFPKDRDIVVYCSCPNEVSSARLALRLQRKGFTRVRPLLGGLEAWRELNYRVEGSEARRVSSDVSALRSSSSSAPGATSNNVLEPVELNPLPPTNGKTK